MAWRAKFGQTKKAICQEIVEVLHSHGLAHHTAREVRSKINDMERSFRAAVDWRARMGEENMVETGGEGAEDVRAHMLKLCRHFDALSPIMMDRPSTRPLFTNEDDAESTEIAAAANGGDDTDTAATIPSPSTPQRPVGVKRRRLDIWCNVSEDTASIERDRLWIDRRRLEMDASSMELETQRLQCELNAACIEAARKKGLARQELREAGVPK